MDAKFFCSPANIDFVFPIDILEDFASEKIAQIHVLQNTRLQKCNFFICEQITKKLKIQLLCTKVLLPFKTWGEIIHVELFVSRITILCTLSKSPIDEKEFDMC